MKNLSIFIAITSLFLAACNGNQSTGSSELSEQIEITGEIDSFGDFRVFQTLSETQNNIALAIIGDGKDSLGLTEEFQSFTLPNDNLLIEIREYDMPVDKGYFSNDAFTVMANITDRWEAISGKVKLKVSDTLGFDVAPLYYISLELDTIYFQNDRQERLFLKHHEIDSAFVGWRPG